MASCGSCGMKIDGIPRLACETQVAALGSRTVTVQPMDNFPIVRDLVVDLESFFAHHRGVSPSLGEGWRRGRARVTELASI